MKVRITRMPWYILAMDEKSPIFYGPYQSEDQATQKKLEISSHSGVYDSELFDLPTSNRARAARMVKAQMQDGLTRFRYES